MTARPSTSRRCTFNHGTIHDFEAGEIVDPSHPHPRVHEASFGSRFYMTQHEGEAFKFAKMAGIRQPESDDYRPGHVYKVEPTDEYEEDPVEGRGSGADVTKLSTR